LALPIVHLMIADRIKDDINPIDLNSYFLGTISPDSISIKENWTREEKRNLHFTQKSLNLNDRISEVMNALNSKTDHDESFTLGYITHIHVDNFWSHLISRYFHKELKNEENFNDMNRIYYSDLKILDKELLHDNTGLEVILESLKVAKKATGYLSLDEDIIDNWKNEVIAYASKSTNNKPDLFSMEMIKEFIELSSSAISNIFANDNERINYQAQYVEHSIGKKYWGTTL
jgi:hypothetical protein